MRNFRRAIVLMMFFSLAFPHSIFMQGQVKIEPVDWQKLADFIIEIPGWDKSGEAKGSNMSMGMVTVSRVSQEYTSGERSLMIHIIDSAKSPAILTGIKMVMTRNMKTPQEYIEKITIKGFPGVKTYNYPRKKAGLIVLILGRFVFQGDGDKFTEKQVSELEEITKKHDLEGIAKLRK